MTKDKYARTGKTQRCMLKKAPGTIFNRRHFSSYEEYHINLNLYN